VPKAAVAAARRKRRKGGSPGMAPPEPSMGSTRMAARVCGGWAARRARVVGMSL